MEVQRAGPERWWACRATNLAGRSRAREEEIVEFCRKNFGVSFPLAAKTDVNGPDAHPLYAAVDRPRRRAHQVEL